MVERGFSTGTRRVCGGQPLNPSLSACETSHATLRPMPESGSSSVSEKSAAESAQRRDSKDHGSERSEKETPPSGQFEQSILEPPPLETPESPYPGGLVSLLSQVTPDSFEVNRALEDLRSMIERTVRREVGWLAKVISAKLEAFGAKLEALEARSVAREARSEAREVRSESRSEARFAANEARLESLESQFRMIRWMLGLMFAMLLAVLVLLVTERRSTAPLPLPRDAAVQVPVGTETSQPRAAPVHEATELSGPAETSDGSEAPADSTVP